MLIMTQYLCSRDNSGQGIVNLIIQRIKILLSLLKADLFLEFQQENIWFLVDNIF